MISLAVLFILAYLLGSIPNAVWIGKSLYKIDVREHGSKNAGATNVFRVLGKKAGSIVFALDVFKGFLATYLPMLFPSTSILSLEAQQTICGLLVITGHIFPVFAGFRGGKGVATSLGFVFGIHLFAALLCFGFWIILFLIFGYVSLGSILSAFLFPILINLMFPATPIIVKVVSILLGIAVILAHKKNIIRLYKGEEGKMFSWKK